MLHIVAGRSCKLGGFKDFKALEGSTLRISLLANPVKPSKTCGQEVHMHESLYECPRWRTGAPSKHANSFKNAQYAAWKDFSAIGCIKESFFPARSKALNFLLQPCSECM